MQGRNLRHHLGLVSWRQLLGPHMRPRHSIERKKFKVEKNCTPRLQPPTKPFPENPFHSRPLSLPLHPPSHHHRKITSPDMADEVYDGAIGIDLGKQQFQSQGSPPSREGFSPHPALPCLERPLTKFPRQAPPTLASPRTRATMSRSLPTSRVASPPPRSSPSTRRSV